jgi:hypothetical protein
MTDENDQKRYPERLIIEPHSRRLIATLVQRQKDSWTMTGLFSGFTGVPLSDNCPPNPNDQ